MDVRQINRQFGKVANQRGRGNEKRVLDACLLAARPGWMQAARLATREEDHDGIDVVIESDVGKLYVQVKSSRRGKAAFLESDRRARVAVVVVRTGDSQEALLRKVVGGVGALRAEFLRDRA
jgi:hypothetical protein